MIEPITITCRKMSLDETVKKYSIKKIGRLDRYLPRHARKTASAEIILNQVDHPHGNKYEVEALLKVPEKTFIAKDSTVNVLAAIDIVEAKLQGQLRKYKTQQLRRSGRRDGGIAGRFRQQAPVAPVDE